MKAGTMGKRYERAVKGDDGIVYYDKEYVIIKRDAEAMGVLLPSLDIIDIGVNGLKEEPVNVLMPDDAERIFKGFTDRMDEFVQSLREAQTP